MQLLIHYSGGAATAPHFWGASPFESSLWASTQDNRCPYFVVSEHTGLEQPSLFSLQTQLFIQQTSTECLL